MSKTIEVWGRAQEAIANQAHNAKLGLWLSGGALLGGGIGLYSAIEADVLMEPAFLYTVAGAAAGAGIGTLFHLGLNYVERRSIMNETQRYANSLQYPSVNQKQD